MALSRFASFDTDSAPQASRALVAGSLKRFGFVPSPVAKTALSPTLLKHLFAGFAAFESSTLSPLEQEVIALTIAFENECHYCMAMHSARLAASEDNAGLLASLREGRQLSDTRLEALRSFVLALVRTKGNVAENEWVAFGAAGYSNEHALDVVLGVGVYMLSTLTNVLTRAPVDPPFSAYAWEKPASLPQHRKDCRRTRTRRLACFRLTRHRVDMFARRHPCSFQRPRTSLCNSTMASCALALATLLTACYEASNCVDIFIPPAAVFVKTNATHATHCGVDVKLTRNLHGTWFPVECRGGLGGPPSWDDSFDPTTTCEVVCVLPASGQYHAEVTQGSEVLETAEITLSIGECNWPSTPGVVVDLR